MAQRMEGTPTDMVVGLGVGLGQPKIMSPICAAKAQWSLVGGQGRNEKVRKMKFWAVNTKSVKAQDGIVVANAREVLSMCQALFQY